MKMQALIEKLEGSNPKIENFMVIDVFFAKSISLIILIIVQILNFNDFLNFPLFPSKPIYKSHLNKPFTQLTKNFNNFSSNLQAASSYHRHTCDMS